MSKEKAKDFIEKAQSDDAMRRKIKDACKDVHQVAKDHGFEFSSKDLQDAMDDKWSDKEDPHFCFLCL